MQKPKKSSLPGKFRPEQKKTDSGRVRRLFGSSGKKIRSVCCFSGGRLSICPTFFFRSSFVYGESRQTASQSDSIRSSGRATTGQKEKGGPAAIRFVYLFPDQIPEPGDERPLRPHAEHDCRAYPKEDQGHKQPAEETARVTAAADIPAEECHANQRDKSDDRNGKQNIQPKISPCPNRAVFLRNSQNFVTFIILHMSLLSPPQGAAFAEPVKRNLPARLPTIL